MRLNEKVMSTWSRFVRNSYEKRMKNEVFFAHHEFFVETLKLV